MYNYRKLRQHKAFMIILLLLISRTIIGQDLFPNPSITKSTELEIIEDYDLKLDIMGINSKDFLLVDYFSKNPENPAITLEYFNQNLELLVSNELSLKIPETYVFIEHITHINNELLIFTSREVINSKRIGLFVQSIDQQTLQLNNDLEELIDIDYSGKLYSPIYDEEFRDFGINLSRDSTKILIYHNAFGERKKQLASKIIHIYDYNLNKIWDKEIIFTHTDKLFEVKNLVVDNLGGVHLLSMLYYNKAVPVKKKKPNYEYQVFSYYQDEIAPLKTILKEEDKFLRDANLFVNQNNKVYCVGYFSFKGFYRGIIGCFALKIDPRTKENIFLKVNQFSDDFLPKKNKKGDKTTEIGGSIKMKSIVLKKDGGLIFIGERRIASAPNSSRDYSFHLNLIIISLDNNGDISWQNTIRKWQYQSYYSSYKAAFIKDQLYIIYNDHIENIEKSKENEDYEPFRSSKPWVLTIAKFNEEGKLYKKGLFTSNDLMSGFNFVPTLSSQLSSNDIILYGIGQGIRQFFKVHYP